MNYTLNLLEPGVLLTLRQQPSHGYDLVRRLKKLGMDFTDDPGAVYRCLNSLTRRGLVEYRQEKSLSGPPRKVYQPTLLGERATADALQRMCATRDVLNRCVEAHRRTEALASQRTTEDSTTVLSHAPS
ncbi:PadR family transcriptional regulator [Allostreptomyces psammosilenae]|uniref:DNA-binding PadR family transcriptional regulator n=1 Tax=Allostreptomyces psammosilenae TaxID=1892865 RepID=A0A853A1U7_9ACTN|nr:PadR family transcriptional regulator [Allostreptomyces psammosilenae]NYI06874.1 DNA-binding PadR family transcriptional regulator [Allostreptomyces psammosilenae]